MARRSKNGARAFGNYVRACAAFDDAGVDGDAAAKIIPSFDARELARQFVDGVDTFLRCETRVRGAAMHDQFGFADSFARCLQQAARAEGRFDDENGIASARFRSKNLREDSLPISSSESTGRRSVCEAVFPIAEALAARKVPERFRPSCQKFLAEGFSASRRKGILASVPVG